ncbi:hypothetical protein OIU78_023745 [Salix suchowensis]|nr:hypothetical protein OIU78_023745 [Salix suchowensis]
MRLQMENQPKKPSHLILLMMKQLLQLKHLCERPQNCRWRFILLDSMASPSFLWRYCNPISCSSIVEVF